jgi:hypothetical protein
MPLTLTGSSETAYTQLLRSRLWNGGTAYLPCINALIKLLSKSNEEPRQGFEKKGSTDSNLLVTEADASP